MRTAVYFTVVFCLILCTQPAFAQIPIIIDHNCTDYTQIPESWIQAAKDNLLISYGHTSHGSQLVTGLQAFEDTFGGVWDFDRTSGGLNPGVFLNDYYPSGDLGNPDYTTWESLTRSMLENPSCDRNVVMWSWCGQADTTEQNIQTYLNLMDGLRADYPDVAFVYMTGHLNGTGDTGNLHARNNQIRNHVLATGGILFDFADIESYDPDCYENYMPMLCTDNCDYDGDGNGSRESNWAQDWIAAYPGAEYTTIASNCGGCAHSQGLNCCQKGAATWWMLATIAGWDNPNADVPASSPWSLGLALLIMGGLIGFQVIRKHS